MERNAPLERTLGLIGATGVGVGAIVGGGVLALAGVAFTATGPSAMLACVLNGGIALLIERSAGMRVTDGGDSKRHRTGIP